MKAAPIKPEDCYTLDEVAQLLQISAKTLRNRMYAAKNHPPVLNFGGGHYLFLKNDVHTWIASKRITAVAS